MKGSCNTGKVVSWSNGSIKTAISHLKITLKRLPEDIRGVYELFRENALDREVSAD